MHSVDEVLNILDADKEGIHKLESRLKEKSRRKYWITKRWDIQKID